MSTQVFISWSGELSRAVAHQLRDWLPSVIQSVSPFMSAADIAAGTRPLAEIEASLEVAQFGIICVTGENWGRPWVNFEAGALSKRLSLRDRRVSPLLIDLAPEDIDSPLKQFQMKRLDRSGVFEMLQSLNEVCDEGALAPAVLTDTFDMWWPRLETSVADAVRVASVPAVERRQEDKIDELLTMVRSLVSRSVNSNPLELQEKVVRMLGAMGSKRGQVLFSHEGLLVRVEPQVLTQGLRYSVLTLVDGAFNVKFEELEPSASSAGAQFSGSGTLSSTSSLGSA